MPDWDICDWQDLSSPTALEGIGHVQDDIPCSEILIAGRWDDFYHARPRGLRRNLRRYAEKAREIDEVRFFVRTNFDARLMDSLITLHSARWNRHGEAGMIAANRSAGFLRDVAAKFAVDDMLRFFALEFQGRLVAVILSFPYKNVLFSYLSAFDPEYQQYGFGKLLLEKSLEYAFFNEYRSWNFLRGDEPYKSDWGASLISKSRLVLRKSGL
jgi:CelD/BcsL family acetyltransferase involved in cellulose biosynthesis